MRTVLAFVLGAAIGSALWALAGPSAHASAAAYPAPDGPPLLDGLGEPVPDFGWQGPGGEPARLSTLLDEGPVVVALRDLSCPLSQRYGVTLEELEEAFAADGVRFLFVDITPSEVGWNLGMAQEQAELDGTYVRRMDDDFFTALAPRTTTEAFLIDRDGILRYRGAVDDQYGIGFARQSPENRYLHDAIETVLDGDPPGTPATFAPGCLLDAEAPSGSASSGTSAALAAPEDQD